MSIPVDLDRFRSGPQRGVSTQSGRWSFAQPGVGKCPIALGEMHFDVAAASHHDDDAGIVRDLGWVPRGDDRIVRRVRAS